LFAICGEVLPTSAIPGVTHLAHPAAPGDILPPSQTPPATTILTLILLTCRQPSLANQPHYPSLRKATHLNLAVVNAEGKPGRSSLKGRRKDTGDRSSLSLQLKDERGLLERHLHNVIINLAARGPLFMYGRKSKMDSLFEGGQHEVKFLLSGRCIATRSGGSIPLRTNGIFAKNSIRQAFLMQLFSMTNKRLNGK
jgi:hypothetical protein